MLCRARSPAICVLTCSGRRLYASAMFDPHRVAADRRAFDAAEHAAERRLLAPRGVGVPGVLVAVVRAVGRLVDAHEPGVVGIAAGDRMILELAEVPRERDVLRARDVLVAEEQHLVLEQQRADLGEQRGVARGDAEIDVGELGADRAGERLDLDGSARRDDGAAQRLRWSCRASFDVPSLVRSRRSTSRWSCAIRDRDAPAPRPAVDSAG